MARFVTQSAHAGVTAIDNAFIIDYMPTAPDGAVKAYIYGLMAASRGDAPDIADRFTVLKPAVLVVTDWNKAA